jgi:UPF0755 protein
VYDDQPPSRVSEPVLPKNRRPVLGRVFGSLFLWFFALTGIVAAAGFWTYLTFTAPGPLTAAKVYEINKGQGRADIAVALQDQGIISDARIFSAAAAVNGVRGARLKPGEYEFAAGATMQDVLAMITAGRFLTYKVTIPEGWTSQMVVNRLQEQKELDGDVKTIPAEGAIMPDTYVFRRGLTRQKLLDDMQTAENKLIDELWAKRPVDTTVKSKEELVTLASIVEKETGVPEERPQVASVFINRLKQGMRLQSDPTIIYGIVGGKGKLERSLTKSDIEAATPYNTYQIPGLPPGPIANPGRAALEAVLNPDKTPYLYFVANGTGGHAFAATLEDHNANVKKWRAQQTGADVPAAAEPADPTIPVTPEVPAAPAATVAEDPVPPEPTMDDPVPPEPTMDDPVPPEPAEDPVAPPVLPIVKAKPGSTIVVDGKNVPIPVLKKPKK